MIFPYDTPNKMSCRTNNVMDTKSSRISIQRRTHFFFVRLILLNDPSNFPRQDAFKWHSKGFSIRAEQNKDYDPSDFGKKTHSNGPAEDFSMRAEQSKDSGRKLKNKIASTRLGAEGRKQVHQWLLTVQALWSEVVRKYIYLVRIFNSD